MPRSGERIGEHSTNLPHLANNYVFNGSSPNTDTWYTGKADYNLSAKQRLSFSFNYFPTTSSYVPADPLFPNDATSYAKREYGRSDRATLGGLYDQPDRAE